MAVVYTTIPPVRPSTADCSVSYHKQPLDHFSYTENRSFAQRVFTNDQHWRPGGPILFYCGNEASVELYVNATGLMWENCAAFRCLMVFAEHRYWGKSLLGMADSFATSMSGLAAWMAEDSNEEAQEHQRRRAEQPAQGQQRGCRHRRRNAARLVAHRVCSLAEGARRRPEEGWWLVRLGKQQWRQRQRQWRAHS